MSQRKVVKCNFLSKEKEKRNFIEQMWFYNLRVASYELRVVSCNFKKINLRIASSFLRVAK